LRGYLEGRNAIFNKKTNFARSDYIHSSNFARSPNSIHPAHLLRVSNFNLGIVNPNVAL